MLALVLAADAQLCLNKNATLFHADYLSLWLLYEKDFFMWALLRAQHNFQIQFGEKGFEWNLRSIIVVDKFCANQLAIKMSIWSRTWLSLCTHPSTLRWIERRRRVLWGRALRFLLFLLLCSLQPRACLKKHFVTTTLNRPLKERCLARSEWESERAQSASTIIFCWHFSADYIFLSFSPSPIPIAFIASQILHVHTMGDKNYCWIL